MRLSLPVESTHNELFTPLPTWHDLGAILSGDTAGLLKYLDAVWMISSLVPRNGMETILWRGEETVLEPEAHSRACSTVPGGIPGGCVAGGSQRLGKPKDIRDLYQTGLTMRREQTSNVGARMGFGDSLAPGLALTK